jgi:hypothetical protein
MFNLFTFFLYRKNAKLNVLAKRLEKNNFSKIAIKNVTRGYKVGKVKFTKM